MPLFDYKCATEGCSNEITDVIEPYKENPEPKHCTVCGKDTLIRKDFYQTWFDFIGTGWSYESSNCNNYKV
jgi:predicted nucleic acid-binding Zn ribbon protein